MGTFVGFLDLKNAPGGDPGLWVLDAPLTYLADSGDEITALPGATTDGASIPRLFWRLIGPPLGDRYTAAAVIHDLLYRTGGAGQYLRSEVDDLFHEMLLVLGVPKWKAWLMWVAVRVGGGGAWVSDRAQQRAADDFIGVVTALERELDGEGTV